jgi:hypothetical protein
MNPKFTAVTRVQTPSGTPTSQIPSRILQVGYGPVRLGAWFFFVFVQPKAQNSALRIRLFTSERF